VGFFSSIRLSPMKCHTTDLASKPKKTSGKFQQIPRNTGFSLSKGRVTALV